MKQTCFIIICCTSLLMPAKGATNELSAYHLELLEKAEKGDAEAQYKLGKIYHEGEGVAQDYEQAFNWYSNAAKQGHTDAQYRLGLMYDKGEGVDQDYTLAAEWYIKSTDIEAFDSTVWDEKDVNEWYWLPSFGIKYDSVTAVTVAGGIRYAKEVKSSDNYFLLHLEAGEGGGKLQFGVGTWHDGGFNIKSSLLRTWGDPLKIEPDQTYLGIEFQIMLRIFSATAGLYTEIDGDGKDETLFTWSAGALF